MNGLPAPWLPVIAWTLLHSLWQGALVALAAGLTLRALRSARPQVRYAVACGALLLLVALPLGTACWLASGATAPASTGTGTFEGAATLPPAWMPWTARLWALGTTFMCLRLGLSWAWVQRLRWQGSEAAPAAWQARLDTLAATMGLKGIRLRQIRQGDTPLVLGWLRPVVLVPASVFTGLSPQALEHVLAHELAHVRRYDYLINLAQSLVEALLFYHPAAWWLSRRIRMERELVADDLAVAFMGDPLAYARALADLEALRSLPIAPTLALAATGGHLMTRIRSILMPRSQSLPLRAHALPVLALGLLCTGTAWGFAEEAKAKEARRILVIEDGKRLDVELKGDAKVDPKAEGGIALGEGSTLELRVKESPKTRRITVKKEGNTVTRTITENGETRPLGKEDEVWLKDKLATLKDVQVKVDTLGEGKDVSLEIREGAKDGQKPKVFVYRSGSAPKGFEWTEKWAEDLKKHLPNPKDIQVHLEGAKDGQKSKVFVYRNGSFPKNGKPGSIWINPGRVEGLDGKVFTQDLSDPEAARKWAEDLQKRLPDAKAIRLHVERATRNARLHIPEMSHDIQKDGDREIHRFTIRRSDKIDQDPAAEASRVRQQIERLQKRLTDLEKQAPKAAK